jgi:hypothetical protein
MGEISWLAKYSARFKSEIHSKLSFIEVRAKWNPLRYLTHISVHYTTVRTTPIDKPLYLLKISINAHIYSTHPPISIPIPTLNAPHSNVGIPCITWTPLLPGRTLLVVHAPSPTHRLPRQRSLPVTNHNREGTLLGISSFFAVHFFYSALECTVVGPVPHETQKH